MFCLLLDTFTTGCNCLTSCENRRDGFYQSCQECDVYASCKDGKMKDNIPCEEVNGSKTYWDQDERRCTEEKSYLCNLEMDGYHDPETPEQYSGGM